MRSIDADAVSAVHTRHSCSFCCLILMLVLMLMLTLTTSFGLLLLL